MRSRRNSWLSLWADAFALSAAAPTVVALRLAKIAKGDAAADAEVRRMTTEKISAAWSAQLGIFGSLMTGKSGDIPGNITRLYRRRVRANAKRLAKRK